MEFSQSVKILYAMINIFFLFPHFLLDVPFLLNTSPCIWEDGGSSRDLNRCDIIIV